MRACIPWLCILVGAFEEVSGQGMQVTAGNEVYNLFTDGDEQLQKVYIGSFDDLQTRKVRVGCVLMPAVVVLTLLQPQAMNAGSLLQSSAPLFALTSCLSVKVKTLGGISTDALRAAFGRSLDGTGFDGTITGFAERKGRKEAAQERAQEKKGTTARLVSFQCLFEKSES